MNDIKFIKVLVRIGDAVGEMTGLEYEGKLWLAPIWSDSKSLEVSKPDCLYRFDNHLYTASHQFGTDYVLNEQLPEGFPDGDTSNGFEALLEPDITVERPNSDSIH